MAAAGPAFAWGRHLLLFVRRALTADSSPRSLRIMLIDDLPERRQQVALALREAGHEVVAEFGSAGRLLLLMEQVRPELVIVDLDSPERDVLESFALIGEFNPTPILLSASSVDREFMAAAIKAGVCAYQAEGLDAQRAQPVVEVALAQFQTFQALRQQLRDTQAELEARKLIERAKGLVMAHQGLDESGAHALLRKLAMDRSLRLEQVAEQILNSLGATRRGTGGKG